MLPSPCIRARAALAFYTPKNFDKRALSLSMGFSITSLSFNVLQVSPNATRQCPPYAVPRRSTSLWNGLCWVVTEHYERQPALARFLARLVKYLDCGVGFFKTDVGGFRCHTALLQGGRYGRKFCRFHLSWRCHDVRHTRHFFTCPGLVPCLGGCHAVSTH